MKQILKIWQIRKTLDKKLIDQSNWNDWDDYILDFEENWINFDLSMTDMITTFRAFATGVRELKTYVNLFDNIEFSAKSS